MHGNTQLARLFDEYLASSGRDGPDASILLNATGGEREQLERDLIDYLSIDPAFAADAIRFLKSAFALPQLKAALTLADSESRAHIARAIWEVEKDERWLVIIADAFKTETSSSSLMVMMALFYHVKHPLAFASLEALMFHQDFLVRSCAAYYYSENSARKTADSTIRNNLQEHDRDRIRKFINKLRTKVMV